MGTPADTSFDLDKDGTVTHLRGVGVDEASQKLIRIYAERANPSPPVETRWALQSALAFAKRLTANEEHLDDPQPPAVRPQE